MESVVIRFEGGRRAKDRERRHTADRLRTRADHTEAQGRLGLARHPDNLVAADGMNEGQVLVDVGIHVDENGLCGDINQADAESANVAALTPVPGGLGPVTNAVLIRNVIEAAKKAAQIV